jgi:hypothetical protein
MLKLTIFDKIYTRHPETCNFKQHISDKFFHFFSTIKKSKSFFELQHILANVRPTFRNLSQTDHVETDDFEASHAETDVTLT